LSSLSSLSFLQSCNPAILQLIPAVAVAALLVACARDRQPPAPRPDADKPATAEWFTERAADTGLDFVHVNGMSGRFYYPEIMGPGAGLFDYDNDGDLDVFLVQGRPFGPEPAASQRPSSAAGASPFEGRLFRNDLEVHADGTRTLRFTDVTAASGIRARGHGMGVAAADFNNDGCVDLLLTNYGPDQLYRNNCDGTFTDVSSALGRPRAAPSWSVSASFVDVDRDGWLDLFIGHYVNYSVAADVRCFLPSGGRNYCPPQVYRAQPSTLYHNNHDGTFSDVTAAAGMATEFGSALGVTAADFNGDGWIDLYVANDGQPNQLWINQRNGTFRNTALLAGVAVGEGGTAKSSMGVAAADFDNDGDEDLVVTTLTGQGSDLFVNDGSGVFVEQSARSGLRAATLPLTGFGAGWLDLDNDGWLDLLSVNGLVSRDPARPAEPFSLQQRRQLLRHLENGRFEDATQRAGKAFMLPEVGRGAAFGDIDNDGRTDVVVANDAGPVRLFINTADSPHHWVGLRLAGMTPPRDMLGARVSVVREQGPSLRGRAHSDGSYGSANDPRVLIGLGPSSRPVTVAVVWPDGRSETFSGVPIDRYTTLTEGKGR
jgi:enediyne biosynthesis protein E4